VVARAYLDQLTRTQALAPERARAVRSLIDRSNEKSDEIRALVAQLEQDAAAATPRDAARIRALVSNISTRN
jgi:hypothetical protein